MPLLETPPDSVQTALRALPPDASIHYSLGDDPPANDVRLSLMADLLPDGTYGERWFIVDQTHLRVLTPAHDGVPARVDTELPLTHVAEARADSLVGSGALNIVLRDGSVREVVRYTLAQSAEFGAAARVLSAYLKDEEPSDALTQGLEKKNCPKCGDPLTDETNVCAKCVDKKAVLQRLMTYALPYRPQAILVAVLMIVGTAFSLFPIPFTKTLTDRVLVAHRHENWIGLLVLAYIGANVLNVGVSIWRGRAAAWLTNHMAYTLRTQAYDKLQQLSISYYDKRQTGTLLNRVTQDVNELQNFLVDGIQLFLVNTLTILGVFAYLLRYDWQLTLLVLVPVPLSVFLTRRIMKLLWGRLHRLWHLRSNLTASISAALSGVRVVKAFNQEAREADKFRERAFNLFGAGIVVEQSWATYMPVIGFVTTVGIYIIWYVGGEQVFHNTSTRLGMTLGTLQAFIMGVSMLLGPLQQMTRIADWLARSSASAERVFEVIDADPEIMDTADAVAMPHMEGRVEFRNVRFSYDKNADVLDDLTLTVEPGEMIGLVGHSGAGKSTIINLLSRFYDVKDGAILIDGVDIRTIKQDDLRRQIGVVLQEPFLFPGTIMDNIRYAKPDASAEAVMRAAKAANAHDFVMRFNDGYDTFVGERGARLSGGERQRLSIARAILHDPRLLILDEATASVDTETEKQIQEAIGRLIEGRTTFAIAHRLSTLRNASRLLVMERGKMVELGTHDELLATPEGVFRRLVEMQQEVNKLHVV